MNKQTVYIQSTEKPDGILSIFSSQENISVKEVEVITCSTEEAKEFDALKICWDEKGNDNQSPESELKVMDGGYKNPKVVCLCGSTRFAQYFMIKRWELEKQGIITFGINILPDNYFAEGNAHGAEQEGVKHILDELHKRKIDLSDEVFVLNVDWYIGESTRNEIDYAVSTGKKVEYLQPLPPTQ